MLWVVLVVALVLALGMAALAWRLLGGDRQRTDARAAALRRMAFEPEPELEPAAEFSQDLLLWRDVEMPLPMFVAPTHSRSRSRRWMPTMIVALFVTLGAGTVYGIYGPEVGPLSAFTTWVWRHTDALPLELVSLTHGVDRGDFVVTGLLQNPPTGQMAPNVMAVVYAFNAKGEYFASGKALLEFSPLAPGAESPFVVRLPKTSGVSRFRVGFRANDGTVVAHVDHRGQPVEGTQTGGD
ncbi:MAG: hypothetical protein HQ485_01290 [Acidobacteria bacterium]|nr:hypothetical protein [Acidobacteriota bacterium]